MPEEIPSFHILKKLLRFRNIVHLNGEINNNLQFYKSYPPTRYFD